MRVTTESEEEEEDKREREIWWYPKINETERLNNNLKVGQDLFNKYPLLPLKEDLKLDMTLSPNKNLAKIRAYSPIPGAYFMHKNKRFKVLEAHIDKGEGLFKGIRHAGGWDDSEEVRNSHSNPIQHIYLDDMFQKGIEQLEARNLTFDSWHYHNQIKDLTKLAKNFPSLVIIHDHFGGPLGIGKYEGQREVIFKKWKEDITELAECPNVYSKLGGMAMPINGWDWHKADRPATSDELVSAQKAYYLHTIKVFGTERCMFESNFPVDKQSISYPVLWNALKKIALGFSTKEKEDLFFNTAKKAYSL